MGIMLGNLSVKDIETALVLRFLLRMLPSCRKNARRTSVSPLQVGSGTALTFPLCSWLLRETML